MGRDICSPYISQHGQGQHNASYNTRWPEYGRKPVTHNGLERLTVTSVEDGTDSNTPGTGIKKVSEQMSPKVSEFMDNMAS